MKKQVCTFCFSLLLSCSVFAQDWNLIVAGGKYNFGTPANAAVSNTILIDSVSVQGSDTIFWPSPQRALTLSGSPYAAIIGSFMGDTILKRPGSVYEFRFRSFGFSYDNARRIFHTKAEVGNSWEFKSGVVATVMEKKDTSIWGVADSIKIIQLSDGNTIRLSKNRGLLFMENKTLVGLEDQDIGVQLPTVADFYEDWIDGAVFEFYTSLKQGQNSYYHYYNIWEKYYVSGKTITSDSILIDVRLLEHKKNYHNYFSAGLVFDGTEYTDTQTIYVVLHPQKVEYPGGIKLGGTFYVTYIYTPTLSGVRLTLDQVPFPGAIHDFAVLLESGLGEISNYDEDPYGRYERKLMGYQRVGDIEHGTIHPDSYFNVTTSNQQIDYSGLLSIYPNPVDNGVLYVNCENCPETESAELINTSGQMVQIIQAPGKQFSVSTNQLPGGLYALKLRSTEGSVVVKKIVIP